MASAVTLVAASLTSVPAAFAAPTASAAAEVNPVNPNASYEELSYAPAPDASLVERSNPAMGAGERERLGTANARTGATSPASTATLSGISATQSSAQGLAAGQGLASGQALAQGRSSWTPSGGTLGMDVSSHQQNLDWVSAYAAGSRFAYVKATEGTYYTNPYFAQQYNGSPQFGTLPLHLASYSTVVGAIPAGWSGYDIWQFTDSGPFVGDSNFFPGTVNDLKVLAKNPNAVHRNWANGQDRVVEERAVEDRAAQDPNLVTTATGSIDIRTGIGNFWNKNRAFYGNPIGTEYSLGQRHVRPEVHQQQDHLLDELARFALAGHQRCPESEVPLGCGSFPRPCHQ